ncbi:hypothetical protein KEM56_005136, partial [Ascosphaera pollenicola]
MVDSIAAAYETEYKPLKDIIKTATIKLYILQLHRDNIEELIFDITPLKRSDFLFSRLRQEMLDLTKDYKCKTLAKMR